MSSHASDQTGANLAAQGATRKQRTRREALLRDHMAPISRIARADLPVTPEVEPLRMPRGKPTTERLAAAAAGMAEAAVPFSPVFVKSALKDNSSLLANWNVVKRVQKVAGRTALPVVPPTPAPVTHTPPVSPPTPAAA